MRNAYVSPFRRWPVEKQIEHHLESGVSARGIYVEGRGAETLDAAIRATRKGEALEVVALRVFGGLRDIRATFDALKAKGAGVRETTTGRETWDDGIPLYHDAHRQLHGEASAGSRAEMARRGAKGGAKAAKNYKAKRMSEREARKIWRSARTAQEALVNMPGWSRQSAYRHLGKRT